MRIRIKQKGDFRKTIKFCKKISRGDYLRILDKYGQLGVNALSAATPKDTGLTASSWSYDVRRTRDSATISWTNSNINDGVKIAVILQYGHGTNNGGYVQGVDYINPALRPIFDKIADAVWKEVTSA